MMPRFVWYATSLILLRPPHEGLPSGVLKIEISVSVSCFGEGEIRKGERK